MAPLSQHAYPVILLHKGSTHEGRCCINPAATRADVYAQQLVLQGC